MWLCAEATDEGGGRGGWVGTGAVARMVCGDRGLMLQKFSHLLVKGLYLCTEGRNLGRAHCMLFG